MATAKLGGSKNMAVLLPALSGKSILLKIVKMALNGKFLPAMAYHVLNQTFHKGSIIREF